MMRMLCACPSDLEGGKRQSLQIFMVEPSSRTMEFHSCYMASRKLSSGFPGEIPVGRSDVLTRCGSQVRSRLVTNLHSTPRSRAFNLPFRSNEKCSCVTNFVIPSQMHHSRAVQPALPSPGCARQPTSGSNGA